MNSLAASPVDPQVEQSVRAMFASGMPLDSMIDAMKSLGLDKIDCVKLIRNHGNMSLFAAKKKVHLSPAWVDRKQTDEAFHASIKHAVDEVLVLDRPGS